MAIAMAIAFGFLVLIGTPIAFVLGVSGTTGFAFLNPDLMRLIPQRMYAAVDSFPIMAAPFFILAGELMGSSGILRRLIRFAECLVGHIRGGLAHVNIVASMIFAGISGSAIADASALGSALIPGMEQRYGRDFAAGVCASAATIGPIIPPSIPMVIYAYVVGQVSVGGLFLAGVVPGVLIGLGMMVIVYNIALKRGYRASSRIATVSEFGHAAREAVWPMLMPVIILGGILGGIFTATEAAAVAVGYSVLVGRYVTRELRWQHVSAALSRTATVTAVVFFLIATSNIVSWILTASMVPANLSAFLRDVSKEPWVFLLLVNVFLVIVGCLLDNVAAMIMIAPILAPIAAQYGIDPLHFGIVFVFNSVLGVLTPPVGAVLFVVCGIAKAPIERVSKESLPFLLWQIVVLILITYFPNVALAIPHLFGYGR